MADNQTVDNATNGDYVVATDDDGSAQHQYVKLEWGPDNTQTKVGSGANALPIQDGGNSITVDGTVAISSGAVTATPAVTGGGTEATAQRVTIASDSTGVLSVDDNGGSLTVDGTVAATQSGTWTVQPGNTANTTAWKVDASSVAVPVTDNSGSLTVDNGGTFAVQDSQVVADNAGFTDGTTKVFVGGYIYDEVAGTALTENDAAAGRINVNRAQVATVEDGSTRGRYATVTASNALKVDASGAAVPVTDNSSSLTVDAPVGTPVFVRLSDGAAAITALPVTDNSGSLTVDNGGTFATQAAQSGTWTVQPGNTANTTPWLTTQSPATSGGLSVSHTVSAGSTNATVVKASAGQLYGYYIYNSNAAMRKVAFHNASSSPTAGASIFFTVPIPPSSAANVEFTNGIAFGTGIAFTTVTDLADSGTTAVAANDLIINLFYK